MHQSVSPYLSLLEHVTWQKSEYFYFPNHLARQWLLESGSLSRLMKTHCRELSVDVLQNSWSDALSLTSTEKCLLFSPESYLLRQVLLSGDGVPWVLGHTLIAQSESYQLSDDVFRLGTHLLGDFVFQAQHVRRDELQVAEVKTEDGVLWARRSRLWMEHQPMLVTELFLPGAPVYSKENEE